MNKHAGSTQAVETLSGQWRAEHRELNQFFDDFRRWAYDVSLFGMPHFGESADRLKQFRRRLVEQFDREDELSNQATAMNNHRLPQMGLDPHRITVEHGPLLSQLDVLIDRLDELEPPFDSWQDAIGQVESFIESLDHHEEEEAAYITWLLPPSEIGGA